MSTSEPEVVKLFGGPGTGKTTTIVGNTEIEDYQGILQRLFNERPPSDMMLIAYTRSAADEALNRLYKLTDVNKAVLNKRIRTIHSLTMGFNNLKPYDMVEIRNVPDKYNFCQQEGLKYGKQSDDDDIMASTDMDEGHLFFRIIGWLTSNRMGISEWQECPVAMEWPRGDEIKDLEQKWQMYKMQRGIYEFDDAIEMSVNQGHTVDAKELFVDECQDLYPLQQAFLDNQFEVVDRIWLAGDDDQCLPPGEMIDCRYPHLIEPEKGGQEYQKPIEEVEVGDIVKTLTGDSNYAWGRVKNVTQNTVHGKGFRKFRTQTGREFTVTDNHKMFVNLPQEDESDRHYVYLMRDDKDRWRVGTTQNLRSRINVERNARCIIPLEVCDSSEEALVREQYYSLEYSIPTITFTQRGEKHITGDESVKDSIYDSVSTKEIRLEGRLGIDLDKPPYFKKSTNRGRTNSVNINIKMCATTKPGSRHMVYVYTSNEAISAMVSANSMNSSCSGVTDVTMNFVWLLRQVSILNEAKGKSGGGGKRFRYYSDDLKELGRIAKEVEELTGGDIITYMAPTESREQAVVTPAGNVCEGMRVPMATDGEVVWEEIVEVERFNDSTEVYDLTISGTHNFTTNDIAVHNTIYEWAGAAPEYFLNMDGRLPEPEDELWGDKSGYWEREGVYILDQSWRMPSEILKLAKPAIEQVANRQQKEIKPHHEGGEFYPMTYPSTQQVLSQINMRDTFVLFRANFQASNFGKRLIQQGIPFTDRFKTWRKETVLLRDGVAALKRGKDEVSGDQAAQIMREIHDSYLTRPYKRDDWVSEFDRQQNVPAKQILDKLHLKRPDNKREIRRWFDLDLEERNYYQKEAVKFNLAQNKELLYPDGLTIETIHWSKGREADTVILSLNTTNAVMQNAMGGVPDAERRLYYVGLTRTKNRLALVEGLDTDSPSFSIDEILGRQWRDNHEFINEPMRR